jgi:hypothetical protein
MTKGKGTGVDYSSPRPKLLTCVAGATRRITQCDNKRKSGGGAEPYSPRGKGGRRPEILLGENGGGRSVALSPERGFGLFVGGVVESGISRCHCSVGVGGGAHAAGGSRRVLPPSAGTSRWLLAESSRFHATE